MNFLVKKLYSKYIKNVLSKAKFYYFQKELLTEKIISTQHYIDENYINSGCANKIHLKGLHILNFLYENESKYTSLLGKIHKIQPKLKNIKYIKKYTILLDYYNKLLNEEFASYNKLFNMFQLNEYDERRSKIQDWRESFDKKRKNIILSSQFCSKQKAING